MADKYSKGDTESIKMLFYQKASYESTTAQLSLGSFTAKPLSNFINYHFGEMGLFGKVNQFFVPVVVKRAALHNFKSDNTANFGRPPQALNFVAGVFDEMAQQFKKCAQIGKIHADDEFLSNLKVYRAYENSNVAYEKYLALLFNSFQTQTRARQLDILDFDDFINVFMRFLEAGAHTFPVTKTGFVKSRHCSMLGSGLVIEIADLEYNNDQEKIDKFINSPNWNFYVQTCDNYGFIIDSTAPWRLMADLDSIIMKSRAQRYGYNGAFQVLTRAYSVVSGPYFRNRFMRDLLKLYQQTKTTTVVRPEFCETGVLRNRTTSTANYTIEQLQSQYSRPYFLKKYFEIRFLEEESKYTPAQQAQLINDCLAKLQSDGITIALAFFERIINKPFDYRGSISYINKQSNSIEPRTEQQVREIERQILRLKNH
jgi:hypothetical protein